MCCTPFCKPRSYKARPVPSAFTCARRHSSFPQAQSGGLHFSWFLANQPGCFGTLGHAEPKGQQPETLHQAQGHIETCCSPSQGITGREQPPPRSAGSLLSPHLLLTPCSSTARRGEKVSGETGAVGAGRGCWRSLSRPALRQGHAGSLQAATRPPGPPRTRSTLRSGYGGAVLHQSARRGEPVPVIAQIPPLSPVFCVSPEPGTGR